ncbi:hypothetical protein H2200_004378 [Cladophialophora chaetospira]|uniref:Xylanolytic transcriptional activator regulatory domain-containing protein n=1 Tax=Cladophialophora chaetospira TaxID=386627 RepID=A0AA39CK46_9EURO|nr:hypothetical protein H2200_004378 [Cladophialophora chaetospira]
MGSNAVHLAPVEDPLTGSDQARGGHHSQPVLAEPAPPAPAPPTSAGPTPSPLLTEAPSVPQSSFLGRSGYITSDDLAIDETDAMQYGPATGSTVGTLAELQSSMLRAASHTCLPTPNLKMSLIRSFVERGIPWMPIVDRRELDQLASQTPVSLLLTAALVAGSKLSAAPNALEWGEKCYFYAKSLIFHGSGHSTLSLIISTILLHWWNPSGPEHISLDSSSLWLRISVGLAHQHGLHREPDSSLPDAHLRRRIWWTLVTRDNQIATSHGRPRALRADDSNIKPLKLADFDNGDTHDALIFIHFVRIISILATITEHYRCGSLSELHRLNIESDLLRWVNELPPAISLYDTTSKRLTVYDLKIRQLHVPFFVALIIFYRSDTPGQQFSLASLLSASFVSGIFEEYIAWGDIMFLAPASIFYLLVASLIQVSSYRYPNLARKAEAEISTVRISLRELGKRFPTAHGAERIFENLLRKSREKGMANQAFSRTLSSVQRELFAPFGPDLCASWSLVPSGTFDGLEGTSALERISTVGGRPPHQPPTVQPEGFVGVDYRFDGQGGDPGMTGGLPPLPPAEVEDFTLGGLDFWWPDWTELDF